MLKSTFCVLITGICISGNKKNLDELKHALMPYCNLWEKWSKDERCNLSPGEIELINFHRKNNFKWSVLRIFSIYNRCRQIKPVIIHLKQGDGLFKDWILCKFLCLIIRLAKNKMPKNFLTVSIDSLEIPGEIKNALKRLGVFCIHDLSYACTAEDLCNSKIIESLARFEITR